MPLCQCASRSEGDAGEGAAHAFECFQKVGSERSERVNFFSSLPVSILYLSSAFVFSFSTLWPRPSLKGPYLTLRGSWRARKADRGPVSE